MEEREILEHLGVIAAEAGPMLAPAGHDELLQAIVGTAQQMFGAGACSLALVEDEDEIVFRVASGGGDVVGTRVAVGEGIAGWCVASGQPIVIEDVSTDARFAGDVAAQTGYVPRSIMAMPLETERDTVGVIEILDAQRDDLSLLELFARQAALAIESEAVFRNMGKALFAAAARASESADIVAELDALAERAPRPSSEFAALAAGLAELARLGPEEQRAAVDLVRRFLDYVRRREAGVV